MATNRIDSLDPALIRPGRIDRKIEFPLPDEKTKRRIFNIHTSRMTLSTCVKVDEYILAKDDLSGADIKAICTEAGLMALRYVLVNFFLTAGFALAIQGIWKLFLPMPLEAS